MENNFSIEFIFIPVATDITKGKVASTSFLISSKTMVTLLGLMPKINTSLALATSKLLVEVFNRSLDEATSITMKVHDEGQGGAGTYSHEVAEQKQNETLMISRHNGHPLKVVLEKLE